MHLAVRTLRLGAPRNGSMVKSPFFARQMALCKSMRWKLWSGFYAVDSYRVQHELEYFAVRSAAGLLDVTPLCKYRVYGKDSAAFLAQVVVRDITRLQVGRVAYTCWCDNDGKVVGDGTVMRRGESEFFVTTTDPCYDWLCAFLPGYEAHVDEVTDQVAALALQGPYAREILQAAAETDITRMRYFATQAATISGCPAWVSRTGYTGDLGYEIWTDHAFALRIWDALMATGADYALRPIGLMALDMCRLEAGLVLKHVDYHSAIHALIDARKSSPYELSLGWTVHLDRIPFNGQAALRREKESGPRWALVGLDIDWSETEALYTKAGLPPSLCTEPWRTSVPVYRDAARQHQVGYATSGTWSPLLKKNIALASIRAGHAAPGTRLQFVLQVEHVHHSVTATVGPPRFFNPARKTSMPP